MNLGRKKNEENSYQIQIMFKKSKFFIIEVYYSAWHSGIKKISVFRNVVTDPQLQTLQKSLL